MDTEMMENNFTSPKLKWTVTTHSQSWSFTQSCLTLCQPMDFSTPGFPVLHNLLEFAQTHVHWVNDAVQPSHPQLSPAVYSAVEIISTFRPDQVHQASILHLMVRWECQVHQRVDLNGGRASNQLITSLLLHASNKKIPYTPPTICSLTMIVN